MINNIRPSIIGGKNKKKSFSLKYVFILFIFLILVISTYFIYKYYSEKENNEEEKEESVVIYDDKNIDENLQKRKYSDDIYGVYKSNNSEKSDDEQKEYMYPSDLNIITETELDQMDIDTINLIKEEIFARHGKIFTEENLKNYFSKKLWYTPNPNFAPSLLTDTEKENIKIIEDYLSKIESIDIDNEKP